MSENQTQTDSVLPLNATKLQATKPAANLKKILVVEDEPDARTIFESLLESEGKYDVSTAVDGVDALAKAAAENYDLILLDIVMPNKDGIEVLQEIKSDTKKYGEPIVIMLTNISGDAAVEKALEIGAVGYKLKIETEPQDLLVEVAKYMGDGEKANMGPIPSATGLGNAKPTKVTQLATPEEDATLAPAA